ncbi:MAG: hypothetical protein KC502_13210, partial [Myxococcales bacterium]|nr:hypothetical protein [Myxococcales bacterium]
IARWHEHRWAVLAFTPRPQRWHQVGIHGCVAQTFGRCEQPRVTPGPPTIIVNPHHTGGVTVQIPSDRKPGTGEC